MRAEAVIVGGGPAGSTAAMCLLRHGIKPLIVEQETFPRYHIGESMSGEAGNVLRSIGLTEKMSAGGYPVKQGVKVYGPRSEWFVPVMQRAATGEQQEQFTWQVRRSVFDHMMLDEAAARGADLLPGRAVKPILNDKGAVVGVKVRPRDGGVVDVEAPVVLDCSGQGTFLSAQHVTGPKYLGSYDKQVAFFSQVTGFEVDRGTSRLDQPGNTLIFYKRKFHWSWAIPIDSEIMSVGVVAPAQYFLERRESKQAFLERELKELNPELTRRLPEVKLIEDVHVIPNYSFQVRNFAGPGFICVGDAHRFVDPIFSFGLYFTLKEAVFAANAVRDYLSGTSRGDGNPFHEYMVHCEKGIDVIEDAIDTFWENPFAFAFFVHQRYREAMIDVFAGHVYEGQPSNAIAAFRKLLERDRTYGHDDPYSVPIGSRFHPERAHIWNAGDDSVAGTERWMREGV